MAGYLKFLPLWLIVMPGMIARILYPGNELSHFDWNESRQRFLSIDDGFHNDNCHHRILDGSAGKKLEVGN